VKTLGIIGGIGPESTIEYYRHVFAGYQRRVPDGSAPNLIIKRIDLQKLLGLAAKVDHTQLVEYLLLEVQALARAGAELALLAANTPHLVFEQLRERLSVPLVSIVEATCSYAVAHGFRKPGLIGTRFTMQAGFYQRTFAAVGLEVFIPEPDQDFIHEKYLGELVRGVFLPQTRDGLLEIAGRLKETRQIDGLILGGTELPLILRSDVDASVPLLDTTRIHVDAALELALADRADGK
jgi:aspartate racemase